MRISARTIARLDLAYSIARIPALGADGLSADGFPAFAAGSEGDGSLLLFRPPDYKPQTLANGPGGFISLCPLQWAGKPYLVASTGFKPVFQAAGCRLTAYALDQGELPVPLDIGPLPYTHRLAAFSGSGRTRLLASTLCAGKSFQDDWSKPGGVYLAEVPDSPTPGEAAWRFRPVSGGLSKNHGMEEAALHGGRRGFLLSAHEGLFFMTEPVGTGGETGSRAGTCAGSGSGVGWTRETIATGEHSDAFAFPWENPADPQVFSLSPFHGNILSRHRFTPSGWAREILDDSIDFGHVLWAGMVLGAPGLLLGERGSRKQLTLCRLGRGSGLEKELIDEGAGPTQVTVVDRGGGEAMIIAAAHARGEVVQYTLRA
jgi:hypothetical protein